MVEIFNSKHKLDLKIWNDLALDEAECELILENEVIMYTS